MAERLLNDMLKATEAFNKLKKINDELKSKVGAETSSVSCSECDVVQQEPLKKENEHLMAQNNQLHLEVISLKEQLDSSQGGRSQVVN